jgi:hypothetical protein
MRNNNHSIDLWPIERADYPADMRNSKQDKEIWPISPFCRDPERARDSYSRRSIGAAIAFGTTGKLPDTGDA